MPLTTAKTKPKEVSNPMVTLSDPAASKRVVIPDSYLLGAVLAASLLSVLWLLFSR